MIHLIEKSVYWKLDKNSSTADETPKSKTGEGGKKKESNKKPVKKCWSIDKGVKTAELRSWKTHTFYVTDDRAKEGNGRWMSKPKRKPGGRLEKKQRWRYEVHYPEWNMEQGIARCIYIYMLVSEIR